MHYSLLVSCLTLTLFACNFSDRTDYKNMAVDTCDCVSILTDELSPKMLELFTQFDGDEPAHEARMMEYMLQDPTTAMKDVELLEGDGIEKMTACMEKIEKKYDDVYTLLSEDQVAEKIITELKTMDGCQPTITILRAGMAVK